VEVDEEERDQHPVAERADEAARLERVDGARKAWIETAKEPEHQTTVAASWAAKVALVALFDDVCDVLEQALEDTATPGAAVGLSHGGALHAKGFGVTSVENSLEVSPETLFQIGSITKTFTGTVAMILVERGELELDTPVRAHLPALALADDAVAERVTLRHLLTHTGGWVGDYFADHGAGDDALARMVGELRRLPQLTPLGEVWSYNNAGFYLAGRVLEVVAGVPFERLARDVLLEPLGLGHTLFFAEEVMTHRFAVGHHRSDDGPPTVARPWAIGRAHHAAGGLASTVVDLLRYARFHFSDGEGILTRASLDEMQRVQAPAAPIFGSVGLTWAIDDTSGVRLVHHGGGTNGQVSRLVLAPESDVTLAVVTNHQRGGEMIEAAVETVVEALGGSRTERTAVVLDPSEYLGTYRSPLLDADLVETDAGLQLVLTSRGGFPAEDSPPMPSPPPVRVAFSERDRLFVSEGEGAGTEAEFLRGADGQIAWFRFGGRVMQPLR
jgi:CubicO group peptidase (beta-lactamase class C family)